uniref:Activin_recp domain-containing protein n=1 Tax=Angiostrongylus cantonensis TaxID=6313 RepID=A0A158P8R6_ANGCA
MFAEPLKCYVGSKGMVHNVLKTDFAENECEEGMKHCFDSYSNDLTEVTASCQTLNTDQKLLDVCKVGCQNHTQLEITVCCCDHDLCNLPDSEKPTDQPAISSAKPQDKSQHLQPPT